MATTIHPERRTAEVGGGEPVVFLIGMRVNRWRAIRQWFPVATAMPRMLRELQAHPELGLLGARQYASGRVVMVVQYWRSADHLLAFARGRTNTHLPAWQAFDRRSRGNDAVGIFHETYQVAPGTYEALYVGMPTFGLAHATTAVPADRLGRSARRRLTRTGLDEPPADVTTAPPT